MLEPEVIKKTILKVANTVVFKPEDHTYFVEDVKYSSVTNRLKKFHPIFDVDLNARRYAKKNNLEVSYVKESWEKIGKDSSELGKDVHNYGEELFYMSQKKNEDGTVNNDRDLLCFKVTENVSRKLQMFNFWLWLLKQKRYIPILSEAKVFSKKYKIVGTFDLLLYDTLTNTIIIVDYKTNKDLYKNFASQVLFPPFQYLLDNPFNIYQLQLSTYQIPLEELGFKLFNRWIVHITEEKFEILPTMDFTEQLKIQYEK